MNETFLPNVPNNEKLSNEEMASVVRDIKKELRAAMNGIASAQMRQAGMPYKVIFGVELPRLQQIASEFSSSRRLAQHLWNEPIRESKLLACMLMPHDELLPEVAELWIEEAPTAECIQVMVMLLLHNQTWAAECAFQWIASESPNHQLAGMLIVARLLASGAEFNPHSLIELQNQIESLSASPNLHLRKALMAVQNAIATSEEE